MGKILTIPQGITTDIIINPIVQNTPLYSPMGIGRVVTDAQGNYTVLGNAPIGIKFEAKTGDNINVVTPPKGALRTPITQAQSRAQSYAPKNFLTNSSKTWTLVDYGFRTALTPADILAADIQTTSRGRINDDANALAYVNAVLRLFQPVLQTDITRHAFFSSAGTNFATAYPNNLFSTDADATLGTLALNDGFVKKIKAAVAATTVPNYDTSSLEGDALTETQVIAILNDVYNNAGFILKQAARSPLVENRPVMLVSQNIYDTYESYLGNKSNSASEVVYRIDAAGNMSPVTGMLYFKGVLMIAAPDVFDDWTYNALDANNHHYAIFTVRDNLQIAFNFENEAGSGLILEEGGGDSGFSYFLNMFPKMDFEIAILDSNTMSVAGFQA